MSDIPDSFRVAHSRLAALNEPRAPHHEDPADPSTVQAMPIVLHMPKNERPDRLSLSAAAAMAVVACCLDERAGGDTAFAAGLAGWYGARIRKVSRRARNIHWRRAQEVPGVTCSVNSAHARACVPSAIADTDPMIAKLQIGGTDLPPVEEEPPLRDVPLIAVDRDLQMSVGKQTAQVGHASMLLAAALPLEDAWTWARTGFELQVRELPGKHFREFCARPGAVEVADAGFTEVAPGSVTAAAIYCCY